MKKPIQISVYDEGVAEWLTAKLPGMEWDRVQAGEEVCILGSPFPAESNCIGRRTTHGAVWSFNDSGKSSLTISCSHCGFGAGDGSWADATVADSRTRKEPQP